MYPQGDEKNPDYALAYNNKAFAMEVAGNRRDAMLNYEFACNLKMPLACANLKNLTQAEAVLADSRAGDGDGESF